MYKTFLLTSSITLLKNSCSNIPVGRVNDRSPLGHSGHRKLQEVVGSMEMLMGKAGCQDFPLIRDQ